MRRASRPGSNRSQRQASALCEWPATDRATHTLMSVKNKIMGVLFFGELRTQLARSLYQRTRHISTVAAFAVGLLDGADNQNANRGACPLRPVTEGFVQRLRNVNGSSDRHDIIM